MEDVHLSARIAKTHRLYFNADALAPSLRKLDWCGNSLPVCKAMDD
jgi:hypothetical protein